MLSARLSVDIGGTFTDLVLLRSDGVTFSAKVSSTPTAPEDAVVTGMAEVLEAAGLDPAALTEVLHGTTVGSKIAFSHKGRRRLPRGRR
jgi:N-methylhydantoinase A